MHPEQRMQARASFYGRSEHATVVRIAWYDFEQTDSSYTIISIVPSFDI